MHPIPALLTCSPLPPWGRPARGHVDAGGGIASDAHFAHELLRFQLALAALGTIANTKATPHAKMTRSRQNLWDDRAGLVRLLDSNPLSLDKQTIAALRPWAHAASDAFVCIDTWRGYALVANGERAFAVRDAADLLRVRAHETPTPMLLTLVPLCGEIACAEPGVHLGATRKTPGMSVLLDLLSQASLHGVIRSSEDLIAYSRQRPHLHTSTQTVAGRLARVLGEQDLGP